MAYCTEADVEAMEGYSIDTNSFPTSTDVASMITWADSIINAALRVTSNVTDTNGFLKFVAVNLVHKMFNNMLSTHYPEQYGYMDVSLSEWEIVNIRAIYAGINGLTFSVGE